MPRRAVLHLECLESQAAAMWVRAIDSRPELAKMLYTLLSAARPAADVRRVAEFMTSERPTAAQALLDEFFNGSGLGHRDDALQLLPVSHSDVGLMRTKLSDIETRLQKRIAGQDDTLSQEQIEADGMFNNRGMDGQAGSMLYPEEAAAIILHHVDNDKWRILCASPRQPLTDPRIVLAC